MMHWEAPSHSLAVAMWPGTFGGIALRACTDLSPNAGPILGLRKVSLPNMLVWAFALPSWPPSVFVTIHCLVGKGDAVCPYAGEQPSLQCGIEAAVVFSTPCGVFQGELHPASLVAGWAAAALYRSA